MINPNSPINPISLPNGSARPNLDPEQQSVSPFADSAKDAGRLLEKVDDLQAASEVSIKDLLAGKNTDITSVVSSVARADMSFKLLVGVRNKLIEAYKQTMNMQI